jgi:hypothetical protein
LGEAAAGTDAQVLPKPGKVTYQRGRASREQGMNWGKDEERWSTRMATLFALSPPHKREESGGTCEVDKERREEGH